MAISEMKQTVLFVFVVSICVGLVHGTVPPPGHTLGQPWPMPQTFTQTQDVQTLNQDSFEFTLLGFDCDILRAAFSRYFKITFHTSLSAKDTALRFKPRTQKIGKKWQDTPTLLSLGVNVKNACEKYPSLQMDETYTLSVSKGKANLTSNNVWGALRGLETFSQIVYQDETNTYLVKNTEITDAPRFHHRGILLDTSRHYLAKDVILANLEAMAYNKINVFHWHIVDDQSFPYTSRDYPQLTQKGAYNPYTHVYSQADIAEVIEFARLRGIRVIPEFDTPGHTQSWGKSMPSLLTQCCDSSGHFNGNYGPIDPTNSITFPFLTGFMKELTEVWQDHYLHLGGDEVSFQCWQSNPNITKWMQQQGYGTDYSKLENYYAQKLLNIVNDLQRGYIVWQEIVDNNVTVRPDTVVHVWKGDWEGELKKVTGMKLRALVSAPWYLDYISYAADWKHYYATEPLNFNASDTQKSLVMGGEACLWAEYVDATNVEARLWPRASAVGERLWSAKTLNNPDTAQPRMEEHRCRMVRRGIAAEPPSGPNYCNYEYDPHYSNF